MSINPVRRSFSPSYGPLVAAHSSPNAGSPALSTVTPDTTAPGETGTRAASPVADLAAPLESALEAVRRQARVATGTSTNDESTATRGRHAPAIGLYRRVSQYSDDRSTASGLMKSWNEIVRENQFEDAGVAGHVKAVAQNDALALASRVLHLTV